MMSSSFELPRRQMLGSVAALAASGLASWTRPARAEAHPLPDYLAWKEAKAVKVFTSTALETRRSALGTSVITPASHLYVHNLLPPPEASLVAEPDAWKLQVEGVR